MRSSTSERRRQVAGYHHKLRELVWVRWIQESIGYPFVATADVTVRPVFQALTGAYARYYASALQHMSAYSGMVEERELLLSDIQKHNEQVNQLETKDGRSLLVNRGSATYRTERAALGRVQNELWSRVLSYRDRLQGIINDLEDGHLEGKCDFERGIETTAEPTPSRPTKVKKKRSNLTPSQRLFAWENYPETHICNVCGRRIRRLSDAELDHTKPASKGGKSVKFVHHRCNRLKGAKSHRKIQRLLGIETKGKHRRTKSRESAPVKPTNVVRQVPETPEPNERKALDNWIRGVSDILAKLEELDSKENPQLYLQFLDKLERSVRNDLPSPSVVAWDDKTRNLITKIVEFINGLLPPRWIGYEERCFHMINDLNLKEDAETHKLLKSRFISKISVIMNDFRFENEPLPLELYQDLNDYETKPMMALVIAALGEGGMATGDAWTDQQFLNLNPAIKIELMNLRNHDGLGEIVRYLWNYMKQFERSNPVQFKKASMLHERAERSYSSTL